MFENINARVINELGKYEIANDRNYRPSTYGVGRMIEEYEAAKSAPVYNGISLLEGFSRHPHYDGDGKIVLSEKMYREIDVAEIRSFADYVYRLMDRYNMSIPERPHLYEIGDRVIVQDGSDIPDYTGEFTDLMAEMVGKEYAVEECINFGDHNAYKLESAWEAFDERGLKLASGEIREIQGEVKERIPHSLMMWISEKLIDCTQYISCKARGDADDLEGDALNRIIPWVKIHNGEKTSRVIRRICKRYELDNDSEWNGRFTRFADAINPLAITRWTILSINPIDYLLMSNGNSWHSCHWIDKTYNGRDGYDGCYSGGTESYMLDEVSFVVYIVDAAYNGVNYELQPKIQRQMFHFKEGVLVQGRLYPQSNDVGSKATYDQIRNIVQRVLSECFSFTNGWKVRRGISACREYVNHTGINYADYYNYDTCTVSILKDVNIPSAKMEIGRSSIVCPECGRWHTSENCITCKDCSDEGECEYCGQVCNAEDRVVTEDDHIYCCSECAENAGYVLCDDDEWHRRESPEVMYDNFREEWMYDYYEFEDRVEIDTYTYANAENAYEDGWRQCNSCGEWVREEDYDPEFEMCYTCADERREAV